MTVKILYVDHAPIFGGAERSLLVLLKGLNRDRFEPILACPEESELAREAKAIGVRVEHAPLERLRRIGNPATVLWRLVRGLTELAGLAKREEVAAIHANVMRSSIYAALAAKVTGRPLIWHVRDIHHERLYLSLMSRLATRIIAISQAVAAPLPRAAVAKTTVVYNGVDLDQFAPSKVDGQSFRHALGIAGGQFLVGNVAWVAPWKGQQRFLEMAAEIAKQRDDVHFVVVGEAADERHAAFYQDLMDYAKQECAGRVTFAGARPDMAAVMAGLDLLVHCATEEPFGRVLVEAMAMSRPVVAIAGGGADEIVVEGETGFLVPRGDAAALARAVSRIVQDRGLARCLGIEGRKRVEEFFNVERHVERMEAIYASVVSQSQRPE